MYPRRDGLLVSGLFAQHEFSDYVDANLVGKGTDDFVGFLDLLTDGDVLRAVLLALSASDALGRKSRIGLKADGLCIFESCGVLSFKGSHVVASKEGRNVDTFGTWHAVSASSAAHKL